MDVVARLNCDAPAEAVYDVCADLERYPEWLEIVPSAFPDGDDAWIVDLRGQIGPFRRRKRLRMVRATAARPRQVVFERAELDDRRHAPWTLTVDIDEHDGISDLTMRLHYGGSLWVPVLDRLLADEIERSKPRLTALVDRAA
jgi:hypothetical protein